jgi:GNAT superfamily N-acetyltransferase
VTLAEGPGPGVTEVTVWHLELLEPSWVRPARAPAEPLAVVQAEEPVPELNRFLYAAVGGDWYWVDRLGWTYEQWAAWVDRPELETWLAVVRGSLAGYLELERQPGGDVEVASFGLLPRFIGRGLGGPLLEAGVRRAWAMPGTARVWVHTCSLDGPAARANYEARGFRLFAVTTEWRDTSTPSPGPWPGAR